MTYSPANLEKIKGIAFHRPVEARTLDLFAQGSMLRLPAAHQDLLLRTNGVEAFGGYFRLFGVYSMDSIDMALWNEAATWKFSWMSKADPYWCFGETAWGDQYAYLINELRHTSIPKVYFLHHVDLQPDLLAESFSAFMETEFMRNASNPYDERISSIRSSRSDLLPNTHIVHPLSLLLGGQDTIQNVTTLPAIDAMVFNGDIHRQVAETTDDKVARQVVPYQDERGRMRLRVDWR